MEIIDKESTRHCPKNASYHLNKMDVADEIIQVIAQKMHVIDQKIQLSGTKYAGSQTKKMHVINQKVQAVNAKMQVIVNKCKTSTKNSNPST